MGTHISKLDKISTLLLCKICNNLSALERILPTGLITSVMTDLRTAHNWVDVEKTASGSKVTFSTHASGCCRALFMALICWKWQDMSVANTISTTRFRSSLKERLRVKYLNGFMADCYENGNALGWAKWLEGFFFCLHLNNALTCTKWKRQQKNQSTLQHAQCTRQENDELINTTLLQDTAHFWFMDIDSSEHHKILCKQKICQSIKVQTEGEVKLKMKQNIC